MGRHLGGEVTARCTRRFGVKRPGGGMLWSEWEGGIVLEQGKFDKGKLTLGTKHHWFASAPTDLPDEDWAKEWVCYINGITNEEQRKRCEYVLAAIEFYVDGSLQWQNTEVYVPAYPWEIPECGGRNWYPACGRGGPWRIYYPRPFSS